MPVTPKNTDLNQLLQLIMKTLQNRTKPYRTNAELDVDVDNEIKVTLAKGDGEKIVPVFVQAFVEALAKVPAEEMIASQVKESAGNFLAGIRDVAKDLQKMMLACAPESVAPPGVWRDMVDMVDARVQANIIDARNALKATKPAAPPAPAAEAQTMPSILEPVGDIAPTSCDCFFCVNRRRNYRRGLEA